MKRILAALTAAAIAFIPSVAQASGLLPYSGGGQHWAIPWYIVRCESGGRWDKVGAAGEIGAYQLMPFHFRAECAGLGMSRMGQHRCARRLWLSQGSAPWTCA